MVAVNSSPHDIHSLYVDHHPWLLRWLQRRLYDAGLASDLAQDTFVKILVARCESEIREPRPFLATIASRLVANHCRREALEKAYLDALMLLPEATHPSPETLSILVESLHMVDRLLNQLSVKARSAFLMAHLDGLSYAEIAAELNVSSHSVKKYLSQANLLCFFAMPDFAAL